ncbi:MAG: SpoIVB peptidase [Ruminococcaceae bacterium]|nr:SpoIVB peptidase [Oscillospiraceae bacterium]
MNKNFKKTSARALLAFLLCTVLLCALIVPVGAALPQRERVFVGGGAFGVRYVTDGIMVVGYCDVTSGGHAKNPAKAAGIRPGDCITEINGQAVEGARALADIIENGKQAPLTLTLRRGEEIKSVTLSPLACDGDGHWRTGLWVRDTGAGIGTVTYVCENGRDFGGLGHGICDGASGCLVPLSRGTVMGVTISDVQRGEVGTPGELKGHFAANKIGALTTNTPCGVFGVLTEAQPTTAGLLPVGHRDELHEGVATCWCTLDDEGPQEYTVKISDIHRTARDNKCFTVTVTDKALLEKTGGIVQGMSGSPIVQDGRLVGAITHVLIGNPTTGYGIFIENMLAQMDGLAS